MLYSLFSLLGQICLIPSHFLMLFGTNSLPRKLSWLASLLIIASPLRCVILLMMQSLHYLDFEPSSQDEALLESALPVVTALAFRIQHEHNELMARINKLIQLPEDEEEDEESEMERGDKEFIMSELLKLAVNLDYADETGRRKMFALVRESFMSDLTVCVADRG